MDVSVDQPNIRAEILRLQHISPDSEKSCRTALTRMGRLAQREAKANAPKSPTQALLNSLRKTNRKVTRKARASSRPSPGGLIRAIAMKASGEEAAILVESNSEAGRYAYRIHELKNKPGGWRKRGPGTIQRGTRADEKFIERAIADNEAQFFTILKDEQRKAGWYS